MKIAVYGTEVHEENIPVYHRIFDFFEKNSISYYVEKKIILLLSNDYHFNFDDKKWFINNLKAVEQFDLLLSIGGDGTFLSALPIALDRNIPIAGINCGRLGFLADISSDEIESALTLIVNGEYSIENRSLLEIIQPVQLFEGKNYAANEFTVHKLDNSSMIKIETYLNNEFLVNYWADGLIIATPTGSTAYSLSVGGPILMPSLSGLIIAPIASHNLTVRPIVIPDNSEIELRIDGRGSQFRVSIDHRSMPLDFSTVLKIRKAKESIKVVKIKGQSFYSTLRNKLMWGADKRN